MVKMAMTESKSPNKYIGLLSINRAAGDALAAMGSSNQLRFEVGRPRNLPAERNWRLFVSVVDVKSVLLLICSR